jgi:hypothetical protein
VEEILDQVAYLARRDAEAMDQIDDQSLQRRHDQGSFKDTSIHMDESDDEFLLQVSLKN